MVLSSRFRHRFGTFIILIASAAVPYSLGQDSLAKEAADARLQYESESIKNALNRYINAKVQGIRSGSGPRWPVPRFIGFLEGHYAIEFPEIAEAWLGAIVADGDQTQFHPYELINPYSEKTDSLQLNHFSDTKITQTDANYLIEFAMRKFSVSIEAIAPPGRAIRSIAVARAGKSNVVATYGNSLGPIRVVAVNGEASVVWQRDIEVFKREITTWGPDFFWVALGGGDETVCLFIACADGFCIRGIDAKNGSDVVNLSVLAKRSKNR